MNESLKQWLDPTRKPRSHYELLGQPLFEPNLDTLKAALRERMRDLLPYQSHTNKQTAQQACELMTQLGAASKVFNNAADLSEYIRRMRVEIRDELRAVQAREGSTWPAEQIAGWLMFRKDIHPEAVAETMQFLQQAADADQAVTAPVKSAPNSPSSLSNPLPPPQTTPRQSRVFGAAGSNSLPVPPPVPERSPISSDEVEFVIVKSATPPAPSYPVTPVFPANENVAATESSSTRQLHEMFDLADAEAHSLTPSSMSSRSRRGPVSSLPVFQKWILVGCAVVLLGLGGVCGFVWSTSQSDSDEAAERAGSKTSKKKSSARSVTSSDQQDLSDQGPSSEAPVRSASTKPDNKTTQEQSSTSTSGSPPVSPSANPAPQTKTASPSPTTKPAPTKSTKGTASTKPTARPPAAKDSSTASAAPVPKPTPPPKPKPPASTPKTQPPPDPTTELLNRLKGDFDLQEFWIRTDQRGANESSEQARIERRDQLLVLTIGATSRAGPIQRTYLLALQGQMLTLATGVLADNSGPVAFNSASLRASADGNELTGVASYKAVGQSVPNDPQGQGMVAMTLRKRSNKGGVVSPSLPQRTALVQLEDPGAVVSDEARTQSLNCLSDWLTRSGFQVSSVGLAKKFDYVVKLRVDATKFKLNDKQIYENALKVQGTVVTGDMRLIATCGFYKGGATVPLYKPAEVYFDTKNGSLPSPISLFDIRPFGNLGHVYLTSDLKTIPPFLAQIAVKQLVVQPPPKKNVASATLMEFLATEEAKK